MVGVNLLFLDVFIDDFCVKVNHREKARTKSNKSLREKGVMLGTGGQNLLFNSFSLLISLDRGIEDI